MSSAETQSQQIDPQRESELLQIQDALRGLRFGAVHIIVQDGVVIQIERTEKRRLRRAASPDAGMCR